MCLDFFREYRDADHQFGKAQPFYMKYILDDMFGLYFIHYWFSFCCMLNWTINRWIN